MHGPSIAFNKKKALRVGLLFTLTQNRWKIDDVLGVWPLHGLRDKWRDLDCGTHWQTQSAH